jgi:hypothetical protein
LKSSFQTREDGNEDPDPPATKINPVAIAVQRSRGRRIEGNKRYIGFGNDEDDETNLGQPKGSSSETRGVSISSEVDGDKIDASHSVDGDEAKKIDEVDDLAGGLDGLKIGHRV